ncbi:hypothetical protein AAF712_011023 [Marasmius tenuissimus]|uniref:Uncharacterized protein n=1 Tax=Marasmius tenuissimus TaxID=585030 RepID=A0ABR2ZKJ8_9AGAR
MKILWVPAAPRRRSLPWSISNSFGHDPSKLSITHLSVLRWSDPESLESFFTLFPKLVELGLQPLEPIEKDTLKALDLAPLHSLTGISVVPTRHRDQMSQADAKEVVVAWKHCRPSLSFVRLHVEYFFDWNAAAMKWDVVPYPVHKPRYHEGYFEHNN